MSAVERLQESLGACADAEGSRDSRSRISHTDFPIDAVQLCTRRTQ